MYIHVAIQHALLMIPIVALDETGIRSYYKYKPWHVIPIEAN